MTLAVCLGVGVILLAVAIAGLITYYRTNTDIQLTTTPEEETSRQRYKYDKWTLAKHTQQIF